MTGGGAVVTVAAGLVGIPDMGGACPCVVLTFLLPAAVSSSLLARPAVAESSGAVTVDTVVETGRVEILPPDEPWGGGANRGVWNRRAWQWLVSFPPEVDPGSDTSGERCGYGQFGPVFFLRGRFGAGETTCVVAEGTAISVIVAGALCTTVGPPPSIGRNEQELQACAAAGAGPGADRVPGDR